MADAPASDADERPVQLDRTPLQDAIARPALVGLFRLKDIDPNAPAPD